MQMNRYSSKLWYLTLGMGIPDSMETVIHTESTLHIA